MHTLFQPAILGNRTAAQAIRSVGFTCDYTIGIGLAGNSLVYASLGENTAHIIRTNIIRCMTRTVASVLFGAFPARNAEGAVVVGDASALDEDDRIAFEPFGAALIG